MVTTRDEPGELEARLAAAGIDVVHVPLITIVEPLDEGRARAAALAELERFDWLIVTSRHAARKVGTAAARAPGVRLAAVGTRTAEVLADLAGRGVDCMPERQTAADLLAVLPVGAGERALFVHGDLADQRLASELRARGVEVTTAVAYRTVPRRPAPGDEAAVAGADAIAFASGSAARAWAAFVEHAAGRVATPPLVVVIGPTTAAAAAACGLAVARVADEHSPAGLAAAVLAELAIGR